MAVYSVGPSSSPGQRPVTTATLDQHNCTSALQALESASIKS